LSKKTATIRVHNLAKELGVDSKDIVAKCQAEGIEAIKNHMSTVSVGLAATVREWFSDSQEAVQTAVETAAPVDLVTVKAKARRKAVRVSEKPAAQPLAPAAELAPEAAAAAIAPQPVAPEAPPLPVPDIAGRVAAEAPVEAAVARAPEPVAPPPRAPEVPQESPAEMPAAAAAPAAEPAPPEVEPPALRPTPAPMNVPDRPAVVRPAGPMLEQPLRTKLSGPKIIRVESPEVIVAPAGPRGEAIRRGGPRAGRGVGVGAVEPAGPPVEPMRPGRSSRRNKRRTATAAEEAGRAARSATAEDQPFNWRTQDLREREDRLNRAGGFFKAHRRDSLKRTAAVTRAVTAAQVGGTVRVEPPLTIKSISGATGVKTSDILKKLLLSGRQATLNTTLDPETAAEVMLEFNIELDIAQQQTATEQIAEKARQRDVADERPRSPVVTILGHVDHGKTSLLDRIRNTNVAAGEAGGITQKTSAFQVPVRAGDRDRLITFIDTPGHEAFTEMRARGANITDIVVLVVAADDGVMPQTVESINHAKAAGVPIVVALNKIDKPEATDGNVQRILGQLADQGLNPTSWGGSTEVVRTSALRGEGIQELLEVLDYQAELLELKADFGGAAEGTVLEAKIEEGRGPVANVLVAQGCLAVGNFIVVGRAFGRVRDILNDRGERAREALPSTPVAVSGLSGVPEPGDRFYVVASLREAEASAAERAAQDRQKSLSRERVSLESILQQLQKGKAKELALVVKADVQGSIDALATSLEKLSSEEVAVAVKHAGVGGVNESDILLADACGAIVLGFNVTTTGAARQEAESRSVDVRLYDVIYDLIDDVSRAIEGMLEPEHRLEILGHAEVRQVFKISKVGMIAGCYVTDGTIERNAQIRVTRGGVVVEKDRRLQQLKRFKEDVREVRAGQECGMKIDGYDDIKAGDVLECYKTREVRKEATR
jgi:translation initiation factor IF-2